MDVFVCWLLIEINWFELSRNTTLRFCSWKRNISAETSILKFKISFVFSLIWIKFGVLMMFLNRIGKLTTRIKKIRKIERTKIRLYEERYFFFVLDLDVHVSYFYFTEKEEGEEKRKKKWRKSLSSRNYYFSIKENIKYSTTKLHKFNLIFFWRLPTEKSCTFQFLQKVRRSNTTLS